MARFRTRVLTAFIIAAVAAVPTALAGSGVDEFPGAGLYEGWTPLSLTDRSTTVLVELGAKPVTLRQRDAGRKLTADEKAQIKAELRAAQASVRPSVERLGGRILSDFQVALNGLKVEIKSSQ